MHLLEKCIILVFLLVVQLFLFAMQEYKMQLVFFIFSYLYLLIQSIRKFYFTSPITLFLFISFFYFTAGSLDLHFYNNLYSLDPDNMGLLLLLCYEFAISLYIFVLFLGKRYVPISLFTKVNNMLNESNTKLLTKNLQILIILFILIYIFKFIISFGLSIGEYSRGEIYSHKDFILTLVKTFLPILIIFYVWLTSAFTKKYSTMDYMTISFIILFVIFDLLFKGDRRVSLSMILGILGIIYYHKNIPRFYIIIGVLGALFMYILGAIRNRPVDTWMDNIMNTASRGFSPAGTEFGPFSMIANYVLNEHIMMQKLSFFTAFASSLPSFIYPDRPLGPSLWFVKKYFREIYDAGGGYAFNIIIESAMNFGYFGPIVLAIFYTFIYSFSNYNGKVAILFSGLVIYALTFSARFGMTGIFQIFIIMFANLVLLLILIKLFVKVK